MSERDDLPRDSHVYAIVDTARDRRLYPLVKTCRHHVCLFAGDLDPSLAEAAPYLVRLDDEEPLAQVWADEGLGEHWGIFCESALALRDLKLHFKKFLLARLPDGDVVIFRFYDPRVWTTYWPTCTAEEQAEWLDGVQDIWAPVLLDAA